MVKCFNKNLQEYKDLLNVYGDPITVDLLINSWQNSRGSEDYPTVAEIKDMQDTNNLLFSLNKNAFANSLLRNLANKQIISKLNDKWYVNVTIPGKREATSEYLQNNVRRLKNYLKNQNLSNVISLRRTANTYEVIVNNDMFVKQDIIKERTALNKTNLPAILNHLSSIFPEIKIRYMAPAEAEKAYKNLPAYSKKKIDFKNVKSFYWNGNAVLIKGRITEDTAIEEVLHPFVDSLKLEKPTLFNKILAESKNTFPVLAQQIEEAYADKKGFSTRSRDLEIVTQALSRHFSKEFETTPTRPWYSAVTDFISWFGDIIKKVYAEYMGGKLKLNVSSINSEMTLSDIAKMLNTSEFSFDLNLTERGDKKIQYSLTESKQAIVDKIKEQAVTNAQQEIVNKLLNQTKDAVEIFESLGVSRVIIDNNTEEFVDLDNSNEIYQSLENIIWEKSANNRSSSSIVEGILNNDQQSIPNSYKGVAIRLEGMTEDGSVILPGVILSDLASGVATRATALRIRPDGSITVIDVKKITEISNIKQSTFINTQRRILENLGYDVTYNSQTILTQENGVYDRTITHYDSENISAVDEIVPENINQKEKEFIDEILGKERNIEGDNAKEDTILDELEPTGLKSALYNSVLDGLKSYRAYQITRGNAIKNTQNYIALDRGKEEIMNEIEVTRNIIEQIYDKDETATVEVVYPQVIIDALKQIRKFKEYVENPDNFSKPEFISKVLNWRKFAENFRGLVNIKGDLRGLNQTTNDLKNELQDQLNSLVGVKRVNDNSTITRGIFDTAIENYVRELVTTQSNREFTPEQLNELLSTAKDYNGLDYQVGTMYDSRDTILALMNKIYMRDKQKVQDDVEKIEKRILDAALKLARISGKEIDYSFMQEFNEKGEFKGTYVKKTGQNYYNTSYAFREKLFNQNGKIEYITIENIEDATEKQLEHNKNLAKVKAENAKFLSPEIKTKEGSQDGEYHKYNTEFKEAREKHAMYIWNNISESGFWVKRNSVSKKEYEKYQDKYFERLPEYQRVQKDNNGEPTGVTEWVDGMRVVNRDFIEINDKVASTGESLINEKWLKLQNPKTELEIAQREYYEMYIDVFENELLEMIPESVMMMGKFPNIKGKADSKMKDKSNSVSKIYLGFKKWYNKLISPSTTLKKVFLDENGQVINNSLPLYFVGSPQSEENLKNLTNDVLVLEEEYKNAESQAIKDEIKIKLRNAKALLNASEDAPTATQISMDITDSLLKFNMMAQNYKVMSAAEDTHLAMIKVLEDRKYTDASGNLKNSDEAQMVARAKKWMKMVFYDNDKDIKTFWDKLAKGIISYTSLTYVGTNVFGNLNNYMFGRLSNTLETYGQRFYSRKGMAKAVIGYNERMLPDLMMSLGKVSKNNIITGKTFGDKGDEFRKDVPHNKYGAMVAYFRMMDPKADLREQGDTGDMWSKYTDWVYALQDAGEFNVQSKTGMAILHSIEAINPTTGATMSLYDAHTYDRTTGNLELKEGFTEIKMYNAEKSIPWNDQARYDIRDYIRKTNIQTHGNYAYEDRMVIQSHTLGQLALQFKKWVAPSIKSRFRPEYFDENLGWMEGRYLTFWNFLGYTYKNLANIQKIGADYKEFHGEKGKAKLQNVHRVMGEIAIILGTYLIKDMMVAMWRMGNDDDDSDTLADFFGTEKATGIEKKLRNIMVYQMDRLYSESTMWIPFVNMSQIGQFVESPIASTRTLGEIAEAIEISARTGLSFAFQSEEDRLSNKNVYYQRGIWAGQMKLGKEWGDVTPLLTVNKYRNFEYMHDFYIK
jgi:hypothetical protein